MISGWPVQRELRRVQEPFLNERENPKGKAIRLIGVRSGKRVRDDRGGHIPKFDKAMSPSALRAAGYRQCVGRTASARGTEAKGAKSGSKVG